MSTWLQIIGSIAAALIALGVIWTKLIKPVAKLITAVEKMTPVLVDLTETFKDTPHAFDVLDQIQAQFRTDSGSSLRDLVNRLESAAETNAAAVENLRQSSDVSSELAKRDREQFGQVVLQLDRLTVKVDDTIVQQAQVAADLAVAKEKVEGVAADLASAHTRADETTGPHGAAADAASQSPPPNEE